MQTTWNQNMDEILIQALDDEAVRMARFVELWDQQKKRGV